MSNVFDVGQLITELVPNVDKMKLYKLCFFSQGWHLAWTGKPLFNEELIAWTKGPVPVDLRKDTEDVAQDWEVPHVPKGNSAALSPYEKEVVENVVGFYNKFPSRTLSKISHGQAWTEARCGIPDENHCSNPLSMTTLREEFTGMIHSDQPTPAAPSVPAEQDLVGWEELLELAGQVENEWSNTLALLSRR